MSADENRSGERPETALQEVLKEVEDQENRTRDSTEQRHHTGEAGETITPNPTAQENSRGE